MTRNISTKFVRKAFIKKASTDGSALKRALGNSSKIVYGPDYTDMSHTEINKDVSKFNQARAVNERDKPMASQVEIKGYAEQLQQDFLQSEARVKEGQFRASEEKREEAVLKQNNLKSGSREFEDELRGKRDKETMKLDKKSNKNVKEAIKEDIRHEVDDMAID
jgi:hypothetical protein